MRALSDKLPACHSRNTTGKLAACRHEHDNMATRHGTGRSPLLRRPVERPPTASPPAFSEPTAPNDIAPPKNVAPVQRSADPAVASPAPRTPPPQSPIRRARGQTLRATGPAVEIAPVKQHGTDAQGAGDLSADAPHSTYWGAAVVVCGVLLLWLYGATIGGLIAAWHTRSDYAHGFLIVPVAGMMLWLRKSSLPTAEALPGWGGLLFVATALGMRFAADRLAIPALAGWSLVIWLAGACWIVAGLRVAAWAAAVLVFLTFMVPIPAQIEQLLSGPVQTIVMKTSAALLMCLGRPAIAEGQSLVLGEHAVAMDANCSGLGAFFGAAAVAMAFSVLRSRSWIEKLALLGAIVPVGILATAARISMLAWSAQSETAVNAAEAGRFGWVALSVAVGLFGLFATYLRKLLIEVETA